jgi:hypothetical protein
MTSLTERANQAVEGTLPRAEWIHREPSPVPPQIDMSDYEVGEGDPEMVPVHLAWLRVRKDVRSIAKNEEYNAAGTRYNFRGVDTVVQAFGPITMRHGVSVVPTKVAAEYRDTTSSKGNKQRECTVTVTWLVIGPKGDTLELQSAGEALDTSDKGTAKAQSVALRVLLLSAGLTPTGDPDPDAQHVDRGEAPIRQPSSYVDEITDPRTSPARLRQIHAELKAARQLDALVANEHGDDEKIGPMVVRIGTERKAAEESVGGP